jgi:hypothetical protein
VKEAQRCSIGIKAAASLLAGCVLLLAAAPLLAHHSFTVPEDKGPVKHWSIELGSPSILLQERLEIQQHP